MGNVLTGVSDRLTALIANDKIWIEMLSDPSHTRSVPMSRNHSALNCYNESMQFEPVLQPSIPTNFRLVFLFPDYVIGRNVKGEEELGTRKVVFTQHYRDLDTLNRHVNQLISRKMHTQVGICWMDHIFIVSEVTVGNLYLHWAREVSIYSGNPHEPEIHKTGDIPLLVSTDGYGVIKSVYPLIPGDGQKQRVLYMSPSRIKWVFDTRVFVLHPCDQPRPKKPLPENGITLLSADEERVRREREILPANEISMYTYDDGDDNNQDDDSYLSVISDGVELSDKELEFFSSVRGGSSGVVTIEDFDGDSDMFQKSLLAEAMYTKTTNAIPLATTTTDSDGDIVQDGSNSSPINLRFNRNPLDSISRRTRVPVGLIPRDEHRSGNPFGRVKLVQRNSRQSPRITSTSTNSQQQQPSSDSELSASETPPTPVKSVAANNNNLSLSLNQEKK
jgi:hypothetical protein